MDYNFINWKWCILECVAATAAVVVFKAFPVLFVVIADDALVVVLDDKGNILALFWSLLLGDSRHNDNDVPNVVVAVVDDELFVVPLSGSVVVLVVVVGVSLVVLSFCFITADFTRIFDMDISLISELFY